MTIRYEISVTAICEICGAKWTPTQWTGLDNVAHIEPPECPRCVEERSKVYKLSRHFDPVANLLG
jgi:hypothetical protein